MEKERKFFTRPIAITDVETTGIDPMTQEIIEIGLVLIDQKTLEVLDTLSLKVKPEHFETASKEALMVNGYNDLDWEQAINLKQAMALYGEKTKDAIFCAHNVTFDWFFISEAFRKTSILNQMDYHRFDLFTLAWAKLKSKGLQKFNLSEIAKFLGLSEEPMPHRAINGAKTAYEIYKKLMSEDKSPQLI